MIAAPKPLPGFRLAVDLGAEGMHICLNKFNIYSSQGVRLGHQTKSFASLVSL